jgi:hypothetical protein
MNEVDINFFFKKSTPRPSLARVVVDAGERPSRPDQAHVSSIGIYSLEKNPLTREAKVRVL